MMGDRVPGSSVGPRRVTVRVTLHRFKNLARQHQSMFPTLDIDVEGQLKRLKVNWPALDQALGEDVGVGQTSPCGEGAAAAQRRSPRRALLPAVSFRGLCESCPSAASCGCTVLSGLC